MTSDYLFGTFELSLIDRRRRTQSTGESTNFRQVIKPGKYTAIVLLNESLLKGRNTGSI